MSDVTKVVRLAGVAVVTTLAAALVGAAPAAAVASATLVFQPAVTQVDFGTVGEGLSSTGRRFVVSNVGSGASGDLDVDVDGDDDDSFQITASTCEDSLAPGAQCVVRVAFRPEDEGKLDARLEVDPDHGSSVSQRLVGIGQAQPSARLAFEPAVVRTGFGSVAEGSSSAVKRFVVRNVGAGASGHLDVDLDGNDDDSFQVASSTCTKSLVPGAGCSVRILFRPKDDGYLEARLEVDPDRGPSVSTLIAGVGVGTNDGDDSDDSDDSDEDDSNSPAPCRTTSSASQLPSSVLDLTNWKLTLPTDGCDSGEWADEVTQPTLASFADPTAFFVDSDGGVQFQARVDGALTSSNTKYPRSELREMKNGGKDRASWSNESSGDGVHEMFVDAAITAVPSNKPQVVAAQIHDAEDDVIMIRLNGSRLIVDADDSKTQLLLDDNYVLGSRFTVSITASNRSIQVVYNGTRAVNYGFAGDGMYFKAGCYTQSNTSYDRADAAGKVVIYGLSVAHR